MKNFFYPLVDSPFRKQDLKKGIDVIKSGKITMGKNTKKFETSFSKRIKSKYSLMVNSGSSANLLALQCLINPYRKRRLSYGDEILIPTLCWSTSLWPIVQSGLRPVFVEIDPKTLNVDIEDLKKKIRKKTKGILLVHVLGNSTNMDKLIKIKNKYNLILIEDTCESLGSQYKKKYLGTFGEFSTFSFYASHQISAGEGGMVCCKSKEDYQIIKSLRSHGWSRGLSNEYKIARKNKHLDKRFIFYNSGFNLRPTEVSAAIGFNQFKDLLKFKKIRNTNRESFLKIIKKNKVLKDLIEVLKPTKYVKPSWFGIPILLKRNINKSEFIKKMEKFGVETRPIISGNFLKQPSVRKYSLHSKRKFKNSDIVNDKGFFIGLPTKKIKKNVLKKLVEAFEKSV